MNSPTGKQVLALVRGGAYAHAGEEEAIELALRKIPKDARQRILDVGCGLGGTAEYVRREGWGQVTGLDIDAVSIAKAAETYPECSFMACDVSAASGFWQETFDLLYSFNAFYAFPDQGGALAALAQTAKHGASLLIFEYTDPNGSFDRTSFCQREEAAFWQPISPAEFPQLAAQSGWDVAAFEDLTSQYRLWYEGLLARAEKCRAEVVERFGRDIDEFVRSFYGELLGTLQQGTMGGGLFTLRRR